MLWFDRHRRLRDQLSAYIDGELDDAASVRLEAHLVGCESCRADLDELRATVDALRELPQAEAPRSFALAPERVAGPRPAAVATPPLAVGLRLATAAVAAALAVVVIVDVGDFGGNRTTDERSIQTNFTEETADGDADMVAPTAGELDREPLAGGAADDEAAAPDTLRESEYGEEPAEPPAERPGADVPSEAMEPKAAPADADDGFDLLITAEIALAVALGLLVAGTLTLALAGRKR